MLYGPVYLRAALFINVSYIVENSVFSTVTECISQYQVMFINHVVQIFGIFIILFLMLVFPVTERSVLNIIQFGLSVSPFTSELLLYICEAM